MDYISKDIFDHFDFSIFNNYHYIAFSVLIVVIMFEIFIIPWGNVYKRLLLSIFIFYSYVVYSMTVIMRIGNSEDRRINIIPLRSLLCFRENGDTRLIWLGLLNILMFLPLGFIGRLFICKKTQKRYTFILFLGLLLLSVSIEISQFYLNAGVFETDDIIFNSLGGFIGILAFDLGFMFLET